MSCAQGARFPRGTTIIEVVVSILVIAIVAGIVLISIARVRDSSHGVQELSALRTHATALSSYTNDSGGRFPALTSTPAPEISFINPNTGKEDTIFYFSSAVYWGMPLRSYYDDIWPHPSQYQPDKTHWVAYYCTSTMFAAPDYWRPETRTGPEQWRGGRLAEVAFPADKAMMVSAVPGYASLTLTGVGPVRFALMDASAAAHPRQNLSRPYYNGEGVWPGCVRSVGLYGMHTKGGLAGRDIISR